ncbi:sensor domain-containing diguanylate cyclase [Shewanella sp. D64]|nr:MULTISPECIES: sensor domain-containing diguanylate cyclase [unclassified Shewanella]MEC4727012.1 sensor domain-containing diguanylate cyclase [Shewanella sp. D64]MEC4737751.1 sensor domain-containing diguanylate cyclase [Shewanella sp. E94]WBJ98227.1 sensor domain-containing diguanylate cyclase [Shewanella sp. MTB7]
MVHINETTFELVNLSSQYEDEQAFLDALLKKAVSSVDGAEMGCIIRVNKKDQSLYFESSVGIDIEKLRKISFQLDQSFEYRLTQGMNDKLVVIDNIENINAKSSLSIEDQERLLTAPIKPIRSTLSSPIHIDGELYAMINLDSSETKAFGDYDCNLVNILTHEASNAIALYQKTHQIQTLANYDSLTSLYNRQCFEARLAQWQLKSHLSSYLVLIDMDNLKQINDNQGHQSGDDALVLLAKILKYHWHEKQLIARYGGDEFIAICRGPLSSILADMHAIQLELNTDASHIYFSFGIAEYDGHWQRAFRDADIKMYEHKRSNKVRLDSHVNGAEKS